MDLFWPDLGTDAAANNLRYALHQARRVLEPGLDTASSYLRVQDEQLALTSAGRLWVDVDAFEEAAASARRARVPAAYRVALDLYAGELLPGDLYEDWVDNTRSGLRTLYLALLVEMARLYEEREDYGPAVEALGRVIEEEPAHEEVHAALMRLYAISGRRAEAIRQYERLREILRRELAVEPAPASSYVYEEVLAGRYPQARSAPAWSSPEDPPGVRKHNLPSARTSFVGREREVVEVRRTLAMTALLTLTGAGGSGKTRLALETARDLVGVYPDGVWFVGLAPLTDSELVAQAVAGVVGVREQHDRPLLDTLAGALQYKKMLLVLDNCEHLVDGAARLVDELLDHCPGVRILATSREPLNVAGEVNRPVPPLSSPDPRHPSTVEELERYESARLFVGRAQCRRSSFTLTPENAPGVAEICRQLDGIPLAIELAASRIGSLAIEQISERLSDSLTLLTGGGRRAPPRQQTLRGTLNWSYELLSDQEQKLFGRMAVFAGGWTLETAERVGSEDGIAEGEVMDLLSRLVEKSLVAVESGSEGALRYRMLEPIRQYASEKLNDSGDAEAVMRRHALRFLALAEEAEPELTTEQQGLWLERLDVEHDNLRVALSWASERGETEPGVRLIGALGRFWYMRSYLAEGRRWLDKGLSIRGMEENRTLDSARASALNQAGMLARERGDYERAGAYLEQSLALYRLSDDKRKAAVLLGNLGSIVKEQGDYDRARSLFVESLALNRQVKNSLGVAASLNDLGDLAMTQGDYGRAEGYFEESLPLFRGLGVKWQQALSVLNLGNLMLARGDHERAVPLVEEGLALSHEIGDKENIAYCLESLAGAAVGLGDAERTARLFGAASTLREDIAASALPFERFERSLYERHLAQARALLDEPAWEVAWERGGAMALERAVEYALEANEPLLPPPASKEPRAATPTTILSRREKEVAILLSRGLSDRGIAEELSISERTVTTHVGKILRKLNFQSRSQVAAWAVEQRLLPRDQA